MLPKQIQKEADPARLEAEAIAARQRARKLAGTPGQVSDRELYQMLFDILENQSRLERKLDKLLAK